MLDLKQRYIFVFHFIAIFQYLRLILWIIFIMLPLVEANSEVSSFTRSLGEILIFKSNYGYYL